MPELSQSQPNTAHERRIVILCGELTPYRVHFHRRVARELPGLTLHTLVFPHRDHQAWAFDSIPGLTIHKFIPQRPRGAENVGVINAGAPDGGRTRRPGVGLRLRVLRAEWAAATRLIRWLRDNRPEAMIVNGYYGVANARAIVWGFLHRVPVFIWADSNIHSDRARGVRYLLKRLVVSPLLAMCTAMLPCASCGREFFSRYSSRTDRMFSCPLEPDYDEIDATGPELIEAARARFGVDPARKRFITVCRLVRLKRVDTAIDAFARIADERPGWDLLIVGDGPERAALARRVPERLEGRVRWTGFVAEQPVVNALYRLSDVMILPSEREAWALVVNEAAASGLAVISSGVVGAAIELVRDGVSGRIFPPGDTDALARAMLEVSDPARLEPMKAASRRIVDEWRRAADPIKGVRAALRVAGVPLGHA